MKFREAFSFLLSLFFLGRGNPVPPEKSAFVGKWQEKTVFLLIAQDGSVRYKRLNGGITISIDGSTQRFLRE